MPDDRRQRRDRRHLPRENGRRVDDPANIAAMKHRATQMKARCLHLGLHEQGAVVAWALAYIEELEAALITLKTAWNRGGQARAEAKTPQQHRDWAVEASKRRWPERVRPPNLF